MSKPEFWWCIKNDAGCLLTGWVTRWPAEARMMECKGYRVVRIRVVEEAGRKK